jgi:hypothetical protein
MPRKPSAKNDTKHVSNPQEILRCHIHNKVESLEANVIHEKVCINDEQLIEFEGKHYCLFHLPTKDKNIEKFEQKFRERLVKTEEKVTAIARLPIEEQEDARNELIYDFRYVCFPSKLNLYEYNFAVFANFSEANFLSEANFNHATFSAVADFSKVTFSNDVSFRWTVFSAYADFRLATFSAYSDFKSASFENGVNFISGIFSGDTNFKQVTFLGDANFDSVTFLENADLHQTNFVKNAFFRESIHSKTTIFSDATFNLDAYFRAAKFNKSSQIFFQRAKFSRLIEFSYATIENYIAFEGNQDHRIFIEDDVWLEMENLRISDAKKISFHTVRLTPNWFVNTDVSEFIFTDCKWLYGDGKNLDVEIELENLRIHRFENPHALLSKACWQLADNHEENKSFSKASLFRQIANESKRLEDFNGWKVWSWHWWYWLSSFYGESPLRAGLVLLVILLLFAFAFMFTNFQVCPLVKAIPEIPCTPRTLDFWESVLQSLATATFQNIEYIKPNSMVTTFLIIFEKILAPLQAALLALAIRRKFMR